MHFSATHSAVVNAIRISRGQTRSPTQTTTIVLAVGEFLRHYLAVLPQKSSILIFRVFTHLRPDSSTYTLFGGKTSIPARFSALLLLPRGQGTSGESS